MSKDVTYIGSFAFVWCEKLQTITIPKGVTYIGESAFYGCDGMSHITMECAAPPKINEDSIPEETTIYVPAGSKAKYLSGMWSRYRNYIQER